MNKTFAILFSLTLPLFLLMINTALAQTYGNLKVENVVSVYDGDTFKVNIAGLHPLVGNNISIQIAHIDTPELKGTEHDVKKLAYQAKNRLQSLLEEASEISLKNVKRGKYFRIIAEVYADEKNIGELLVNEGLAKPYEEGKRPKWN